MSDKQKRKPNENEQKKEKKMKRWDVEDLMDVYKSVYKRKNGAMRRR